MFLTMTDKGGGFIKCHFFWCKDGKCFMDFHGMLWKKWDNKKVWSFHVRKNWQGDLKKQWFSPSFSATCWFIDFFPSCPLLAWEEQANDESTGGSKGCQWSMCGCFRVQFLFQVYKSSSSVICDHQDDCFFLIKLGMYFIFFSKFSQMMVARGHHPKVYLLRKS